MFWNKDARLATLPSPLKGNRIVRKTGKTRWVHSTRNVVKIITRVRTLVFYRTLKFHILLALQHMRAPLLGQPVVQMVNTRESTVIITIRRIQNGVFSLSFVRYSHVPHEGFNDGYRF